MTPEKFITKWRASELNERSAAQEHFIDLCRLLGEPTPAEDDPSGQRYCFERGARKDTGGRGWADVWKRHCFAWEYKGKHKDLDAAFNQLRQYALALENPPLLIVSDMARFRIYTNWTNSVSVVHEFTLEDLADAAVRDKLKWAMSDPERLRPGESRQALTERAATSFAALAQALRTRGHDPQEVAHFVNRLVFCMFAEDVGLLPNDMFTRMLEHARSQPEDFADMARQLFGSMATGGRVGFETVAWFNGGLFDSDDALALTRNEIETTLEAAALDWSEIDPSILGTLFERGLDPEKRSQLGAHYTDRDKIMQIVEPVVVRPWLSEWEKARAEIALRLERADVAKASSTRTRQRGHAERTLLLFLDRLRAFTVLDPACGSGNFLYLALHALKDLEHRVQLEAESMGLQRSFPAVGPANVKGIELNPYAAELARVSVWIGEIQWMRRNGFSGARDPILDPLDTIECRDAILNTDGTEPEWPDADVVIGNPPFLGWKLLRSSLGASYKESLRSLYKNRIHGLSDLVCYWFEKANQLLVNGRADRVGLVATNSIRHGRSREVLDRIVDQATIINAWSDEEWVLDGADVRVSLVCVATKGEGLHIELDGQEVKQINADLTSGIDLTQAVQLPCNSGVSFNGNQKTGQFEVDGELARQWLSLPANVNGRGNRDVLKPWVNGVSLVGSHADKWIIDFGVSKEVEEAAFFEAPFSHVVAKVKPRRLKNNNPKLREKWWRHESPRPAMRNAILGLRRYLVTPLTSKYRIFLWCDARICPDVTVVAIAREDDTTFGIMHSRFHEAWSLKLCTWMGKGNDPSSSTIFY
jgi:type II restriction/modification system DNA methylase subunit YeeA